MIQVCQRSTVLLSVTVLVVSGATPMAAPDAPLVDNQRVTVWETTHQTPTPEGQDVITIDLARGAASGSVQFLPLGRKPSTADSSATHQIVIALKAAAVAPIPNTSGFPLAFPRPRGKKLLENDRVIIWDYTWTPGVATPMHFHDKDVVVTYLADGALESTDPLGQSVVNPHTYGFTKFNPRDRVHTETLIRGEGRAIIVELK